MTFNAFKSKLTGKNIKSGAKKVLVTTSIIGILFSTNLPVAYAAVSAENIIGEHQVQEDQTKIKIQDSLDIYRQFYGFDKTGTNTTNISDISKAIELSNVLNDYFFDSVIYTNTTKKEVLSLDISSIYTDYKIATEFDKFNVIEFCEDNLTSKPAIDAYITFSCGTMSNYLKSTIADKVSKVISSEGFEMTSNPKVLTINNNFYVLLEIEGQLQVIKLAGEDLTKIIALCNNLDYHFNTAINNIGGYSSEYENTFAYNGVDKDTIESVWLSFPNSKIQAELRTAIDTYHNLIDNEYEFTSFNPENKSSISKEEKDMLKSLGYDDIAISNSILREMSLQKVKPKKLAK